MVKIGDMLHGMRIVKSYNGHNCEERPLFSGFEGYVVWDTWDTGDLQVLKTWTENGEFLTEEIGIIDDSLISDDWNDEQVADFIKTEACKMLRDDICQEISVKEVKDELIKWNIIAPRNEVAIQHVSKKTFNAFAEKLAEYVNKNINITANIMEEQLIQGKIAVDEVVAQMIQNHEGRK